MPSLIPGYEYDIFISYRQNDNRSGWITEFIKNLQEELSATLKEPVSVYFDSNPHDGLLETHNVDKSLEGKLKCLIFIPILSQTYCDPKSFAWQHELLVFNKIANEDRFGRDIKLGNGNVANRILPVRIHDLDAEDKIMLEKEMRAVLRAIDFIYKEAGVNRPLKPDDNGDSNLNKTRYRNQINKVANAIKELISGLKSQDRMDLSETNPKTVAGKTSILNTSIRRSKVVLYSVAFLALLIIGYFLRDYFKAEPKDEAKIEKSIAVLPFADMSPGKDQEYFSDGLSEEVLNLLEKIPELKVIARTSAFSFKGKDDDIRSIAKKLGVAHILEGSVRKDGNQIRVTAQLIRAADGAHLWSETYNRQLEGIFKLQDEIAGAVVDQLKVTLLTTQLVSVSQNKEVYDLTLRGKYFFLKASRGQPIENFAKALDFYNQALAMDSLDARGWAGVGEVNSWQVVYGELSPRDGFEKAREAATKSIMLADNLAAGHYMLGFVKIGYDWDWDGAEVEFKKVLSIEPGHVDALLRLSNLARYKGRPEEAVKLTSQAIALNPLDFRSYLQDVQSLTWANRLDDALVIAKKAQELEPEAKGAHFLIGRTYLLLGKNELALSEMQISGIYQVDNSYGLALVYHAMGRKKESDEKLNYFISKYGKRLFYVAQLYSFRGEKDKAFEWLEKAYAERDPELSYILYGNPLLKNIENDPRYTVFLRKMNLPIQ